MQHALGQRLRPAPGDALRAGRRTRIIVEYVCSNKACTTPVEVAGLCDVCEADENADDAADEAQSAPSTRDGKAVARSLPNAVARLERLSPGWQAGVVLFNPLSGETHIRHTDGFTTMMVAAPFIHVISRAPQTATAWAQGLAGMTLSNHKQAQMSQRATANSLGKLVCDGGGWGGRAGGACVATRRCDVTPSTYPTASSLQKRS